MKLAQEIDKIMMSMHDDSQASHLMRFFKCGQGEYGEGDMFLGIRVPQTREIVKSYRKRIELADSLQLINSPWHEVRLAGFLLMGELYKSTKKKSDEESNRIVETYVDSLDKANNWDLVDLTAWILGDWIVAHPEKSAILYGLSEMDGKLWHQRTAIVANWMLIKNHSYAVTFDIAKRFLNHPHDLIHKATGWMLREVGKRGGKTELLEFLDNHVTIMPRTMLRYAIEKFPEEQRQHYLNLK